jgi:hypothetical protein
MRAADEQTNRLSALHDAYTWRVNAAIAAGRPELARELADEYADEALTMIAGSAGSPLATKPADQPATGWLRRFFARH